MGGYTYDDSEIPAGLKIVMNSSANGLSVGQTAAMTISGTLPYHNNLIDRNTTITLYKGLQRSGVPQVIYDYTAIYIWFMKDCTIYDNSSISFTGVDPMAFINNSYTIGLNPGVDTEGNPIEVYDTMAQQLGTAQSTISDLCGHTTYILSNAGPDRLDKQPQWSIKQLLEAVGSYLGVNWYCVYNTDIYISGIVTYSEAIFTYSECTPLTVGPVAPNVHRVRVFKEDKEVPVLNRQEHETLDMYGIYEFTSGIVTDASTMKVVTPLMRNDSPTSQFTDLLGMNFGRPFSCAKVPVGTSFIPPFSYIGFTGSGFATGQFYLTHAEYSLTTEGMYASISGTTKAISDYEYVGKQEVALKSKVNVNTNYAGTIIDQKDGLEFNETETTVAVNSG